MFIQDKIKKDTFNNPKIIYREKKIRNKTILIVYYELLIDSDKVSDFIVKSLDNINYSINIYNSIINNIYNFKYKELKDYNELLEYLNQGFTILIVDDKYIALETKKKLTRAISAPEKDISLRGPNDSFVEDYETNLGLIKKRLRSNNLCIKELKLGSDTKTNLGVLYLDNKVNNNTLNKVLNRLNSITNNISSIDDIKNKLSLKKYIFPTCKSSERPDIASLALLSGKLVIVCDNSNYVFILPIALNDFFKTSDDKYSNKLNATTNRIIKYLSFFIALLLPAIYIALINYNQEVIPTSLLIQFCVQRSKVPFPAFFEAFIMLISFELLKEADLRTPGINGNSLSIVGALVLGDAAVSASIVSPIMIIVIALSAICSLPFQEPEITNAIRLYRLLFMVFASFLGLIGIVLIFIFLIIRLNEIDMYNEDYLEPIVPHNYKENI